MSCHDDVDILGAIFRIFVCLMLSVTVIAVVAKFAVVAFRWVIQ